MLSFTTSYSLECCVKWGKVGKIIIVKNKNVRGAVVSVPKTKALLTPTIKPFLPNVSFLNSLKRSENQRLSNFFRGYTPPINLQTVQAPLPPQSFYSISPSISVFCEFPLLNIGFFSECTTY